MPSEVIETLTKIHAHIQNLNDKFLEGAKKESNNQKNIVDVYLSRQLENYSKHLLFITEKLTNDIPNSQMYLSQLRTLIDISCSVIFVLSLETTEAAQIIFCEDLITLKKLMPDSFEASFLEYASDQPNLFSNIEGFPKTHDVFSKTRLKKIKPEGGVNLFFPETFETKIDAITPFILSNAVFVSSSIKLNIPDSFLHTWNSFSYHVHGSHLFKDQFGKEHFWLASKTTLSSIVFIEIHIATKKMIFFI